MSSDAWAAPQPDITQPWKPQSPRRVLTSVALL